MNGLTSFDLRSPVEPEWGRSTGSAEQVIMVDRKEHHDNDRQTTNTKKHHAWRGTATMLQERGSNGRKSLEKGDLETKPRKQQYPPRWL